MLYSQEAETAFVWEGGVALNYEIKNSWSANSSLGKRSSWLTESKNLTSDLAFFEFDQFIAKKVDPSLKVSLSYKYRWVDPAENFREYEHRTTQQMALSHMDRKLRLVSRLRTEQRFRNNSFAHRYRYRFSIDFP